MSKDGAAALWDLNLEIKALKTALNGGPYADKMYAFLKPEHLHTTTAKKALKRLNTLMSGNLTTLPSWRMLLSDSELEDVVESALVDSFEGSAEAANDGDFQYLTNALSELARKRSLYSTVYKAQTELLAEGKKDAKELASEVSSALVQIDDDDSLTEICLGSEYNDLADDVFRSFISDEDTGIWLPSGYKSFDTQSKGFQPGDVVCLGATTGGGKCCHYNTLIPTSEGVLPIGELHAEFGGVASGWSRASKKIWVYTTEGQRLIEGFFRTTTSKTIEVSSTWGDVFRGTPEHRLLCLDNIGALKYKHLSEIKEGDWLPKSVGTQMYGAEDLPLDIAEVIPEYCSEQSSPHRCVPKAVLRAGKSTQAAFLRGLFEGDGTVYLKTRGKKEAVWNLEFDSLSETLVYQVKGLLDNMGILCAVRQKKSWTIKGSPQLVPKVTYCLSLNRASFFDFYKTIGFISECKNRRLKQAIFESPSACLLTTGKENCIPAEVIKQYVRRLRRLSRETEVYVEPHGQLVSLGEWHCFTSNVPIKKLDTRNWCSRYWAEKILSIHLEEHVHPVLKEKVSKDAILAAAGAVVKEQLSHVWMQVSKIVVHKEETPVYDLSVKGKREYSASGFMSHNSQMALNLMKRAYMNDFDVVMASYEMSYEQIVARYLSLISNLKHDAIRAHNLNKEERKFLEWAWYDHIIRGVEKGNNFWLACPTTQNTVFEVGMRYKSKKPMAIIFDYINLLKTNSKHSDAQWMMLGEIAKEGKVLARKLKCVVILLMQVDKEHNVRYSQAIKDHADWIWTWVYDEEAKTNGFVTVKQIKTRSAPSYDFPLVTRFDVSQFRDPEEEDPVYAFTDSLYKLTIEKAKDLKLYGRTMNAHLALSAPPPKPVEAVAAHTGELAPRTTPPRLYAVD